MAHKTLCHAVYQLCLCVSYCFVLRGFWVWISHLMNSDFLCFFVSPFMQIPEYFFRTNHEQFLIHLSKFIFCVIQSLCAKQFMQLVSIAKTCPTWFWCTTAIITEIYFEFGVTTFMKAKRVSSQIPPLSLFIIFLSGLTVCNLCAWKYVPGNQWNKYLHT